MKILIGSTGFVGSNLLASTAFDFAYHSTDIQNAYGKNPDLLIYAGLSAAKFLANAAPDKDLAKINEAEQNILKINPKKIVLISTIDVLGVPQGANENANIDISKLTAYGLNRYKLEKWVRENYNDALIVRLPALFGKNIKKNFVYDLLNLMPKMLNATKYSELATKEPLLKRYYRLQANNFYALTDEVDKENLTAAFKRLNFSALNFTDSRNRYQFYPLARLWRDIECALSENIKLLHLATEPVSASELYEKIMGRKFVNEFLKTPLNYNFKTKYTAIFGGSNGYILDKDEVINELKNFMAKA